MKLRTLAVLAGFGAMRIFGQGVGGNTLEAHPSVPSARGEVVREIDDPHTGARWLLLRDDTNPAGPGRLVLIAGSKTKPGVISTTQTDETGARHEATSIRPVIRAGDVLIVEEHSQVADVRLEAVALGSAAMGDEFMARLKIGGRVVHTVAISAGHAALAPTGRDAR